MNFAFVTTEIGPDKVNTTLRWQFYDGYKPGSSCTVSANPEDDTEGELFDEIISQTEECDFILTSNKATERLLTHWLHSYEIPSDYRFLSLRTLEKLVRKMQLKGLVKRALSRGRQSVPKLPERHLSLLESLPPEYIAILKKSRDSILPEHLAGFIRNELPEAPGVYYFLDRNKRPLYIGKAGDLRKRVISHFSASEEITKLFSLYLDVKEIEYEATGSFLLAGLLEDHEIRHYWPVMNKAQKNPKNRYSIVALSGRTGTTKLNITTSGRAEDNIAQFHSYPKAVSFLSKLLEEYQLDEAASAIQIKRTGDGKVSKHKLQEQVLLKLKERKALQIYRQPGRRDDETGFVAVVNGAFCGYGYLPETELTKGNEEAIISNMFRCRSSVTTEKLLNDLVESGTPMVTFTIKKGAIPSGTAPRYARALTFDFQQ